MSAERCVLHDLMQNYKELFRARDEELEHGRELLTEQRKLHDVVSLNKVSNSIGSAAPEFRQLASKANERIDRS